MTLTFQFMQELSDTIESIRARAEFKTRVFDKVIENVRIFIRIPPPFYYLKNRPPEHLGNVHGPQRMIRNAHNSSFT